TSTSVRRTLTSATPRKSVRIQMDLTVVQPAGRDSILTKSDIAKI
ncbi:hypothetical protein RRG08_064896, partial [Elysia crispata]